VTTAAVVLCWNDAERVLRLLARLSELDPVPGRIVVVDNGSSNAEADRIASAVPEADVLRLPANAGFAAAANRGIERALAGGASEVWLLNTDVELPPDTLACLRRALGSGPRCGMAAPVLTDATGRTECHGGGRVSLWTGACVHALSPRDRLDYLAAACLLLDAEMLRETGGFDESYFFYWEDVELGFRAREHGWTLAVDGDCRVAHDEGSTLGKWSRERWELLFRGMMRFVRARSPLPAVPIAVRLVLHSATMLKNGRPGAAAGAWRALAPRPAPATTAKIS
jgi:N-acetylglucosaminyl-diphospho-decaprenol L-rhamnosyltransferase